jgi:hypothetical protein
MNNNLDLGSFILQLLSLEILFKDYNNGDLMNELQNQDEKYLKQILKNQEEILKILNEGREKNGK